MLLCFSPLVAQLLHTTKLGIHTGHCGNRYSRFHPLMPVREERPVWGRAGFARPILRFFYQYCRRTGRGQTAFSAKTRDISSTAGAEVTEGRKEDDLAMFAIAQVKPNRRADIENVQRNCVEAVCALHARTSAMIFRVSSRLPRWNSQKRQTSALWQPETGCRPRHFPGLFRRGSAWSFPSRS